ncbi:MAG: glycosyltransferase family 2 protein [Jejuia sp.]
MCTNKSVSIITPTYNSSRFIIDTIESVVNQTYPDWELIIIDDASTDSTIKIIEEHLQYYSNIKLLKNLTNKGAAFTRNRGIEIAKGNYIAFLDGDDIWKPHKLEVQIAFMEKHKLAVCYSSYDLMDEHGNSLEKTVMALSRLSYTKFLKSNYIGNLTGIYNAKMLGKIYAPYLRKRQDWLLWLNAVKKSGQPALGIQESLAVYRLRKNSMSSNKFNLVKYNYLVYRRGLKFSFIKSVYSMLIFLKEHFFVKSKLIVNSQKT